MKKRYWTVPITWDAKEQVIDFLRERKLYVPEGLYRVFTRPDESSIERILECGTDRYDPNFALRTVREGVFNLRDRKSVTEYFWAGDEACLEDELQSCNEEGIVFVSVYDHKRVERITGTEAFEFSKPKEAAQALRTLLRLDFKIV